MTDGPLEEDLPDDEEPSGEDTPDGGPPPDLPEVVAFLARNLVEFPDAVRVEEVRGESSVTLRLKVDQRDMGKVIGRGGRTARAIRSLVRAAGTRAGVAASVEIVE